jgi:hypothetical protein
MTLSIQDTLCNEAECQYAEGRILFIVMLNFIMLIVVMLSRGAYTI